MDTSSTCLLKTGSVWCVRAVQELVEALVDAGVLRSGTLGQCRAHLIVQGLAQFGGGRPNTAASSVDSAVVGGCSEEVP